MAATPAPAFTPGFRLIDPDELNKRADGRYLQNANGLTQAGLSTAGLKESGNVNLQVSAAGNGNAADTTDDVLFVYTLPANALDQAGRQVIVNAAGSTAANGNNKQIKIWWGCTAAVVGSAVSGGTAIASSGTVTTNNGGWAAQAIVSKYGAGGSNTQLGQGSVTAGAVTIAGKPAALTASESGAIIVAVTGASGTTGAANDVLGQFFEVVFSN